MVNITLDWGNYSIDINWSILRVYKSGLKICITERNISPKWSLGSKKFEFGQKLKYLRTAKQKQKKHLRLILEFNYVSF